MKKKAKVLEAEIVDPMADVVKDSGINPSAALALRTQFSDHYDVILELREEAEGVTDPENADHQKLARTVRLGLKAVRCEIEKIRKSLKAESLARGKAIDGFANVLKYLCEPIEAQMLDTEQHAARQEELRIAEMIKVRMTALAEIGADPALYKLDTIDDEAFGALLSTVKQAQELQAKAEADAESDRIAKEKADIIERERIAKENATLKAKNAKADAALAAAREATAKAEAEAQSIKDDIAKVYTDKVKAEKKAAQAPDKEKIEAFASSIESVPSPDMTTDAAEAVMNDIIRKQLSFGQWIRDQASSL